jgi:membrane protease YdiL (CAAX protease family)
LFVSFYVATFIVAGLLHGPWIQWNALASVVVATVVTVAIVERGKWDVGLAPRYAIPELARGMLFGAALIATCALLIVLTTDVRHEPGRGFPWLELMTVFIPASVHEELLFRGYAFQKLLGWNRIVALALGALVFAALHAGNHAVTELALFNIFLGGILLGLAYERYRRLWFPIGLHLAWNVMSGPILGHEVSGFTSMASVLIEIDRGADWLTGGAFGIEGSVWMTAAEAAGIALLWKGLRTREGVI